MKAGDYLRYSWKRISTGLDRKKKRGWSGISILVFQEDSADHPRRLRINYYVLTFVLLVITGLPAVSLVNVIHSALKRPGPQNPLEKRRALLGSLQFLSHEKLKLLSSVSEQIQGFQKVSGPGMYLLPDSESILKDPRPLPGEETPIDSITGERNLSIRLHQAGDTILQNNASIALNRLWNRFTIHERMPRGRPLATGVGFITSPYGFRVNPFNKNETGVFHSGVDMASAPGTPILATAPGEVIFVNDRNTSGYGLYVKIHHGYGYVSLYSHNSRNLVQVGDIVKKGQPIALMGRTGAATGNHVHYEVIYGADMPVNPIEYIQIK